MSVVVLDLDGTVYQHQTFHRHMIDIAIEGSPYQRYRSAIVDLVDRILAGEGPIALASFLLPPDQSTTIAPQADLSAQLEHTLVAAAVGDYERAHRRAADERLLCLADAWSLCFYVLRLLDLEVERLRNAFYRVREWMLTGPERLLPSAELNASIRKLDRCYLQTNSPEDTGRQFIDVLLADAELTAVTTGAEKPTGLGRLLDRLQSDGVPMSEVVCVGDHPWNDLQPARDRGAGTVLISPYVGLADGQWDRRLRNQDQLVALLQELAVG